MCLKTIVEYILNTSEIKSKKEELERRSEILKHREELLERQMKVYERGEKRLFSIIELHGDYAYQKLSKPINQTIIKNGDMIQNN